MCRSSSASGTSCARAAGKGLRVSKARAAGGGKAGRVWFDCLPWYNYLAFDIIGDLAFGSPFGMIKAAKDAAPVAVDQREAIASYGKEGTNEVEKACLRGGRGARGADSE